MRIKPVLEKHSVSYKVISSLENLGKLNSGEYTYSQIGKFMTIYPRNDEEFKKILEDLYVATLGFQAIDIPSDFRYKNSYIIFYRYGEINITNKESSIKDSRLREIPKGITVPIKDYYIKRYEKMPDNYTSLICVRTRGKSRVFYGFDNVNNIPIIIKEGIMLGEVNSHGYDGVKSITQEMQILSNLSDIKVFPKLIDYFYVGNSFVVIEEYIKGKTIKQLIKDENYSLLSQQKDNILMQVLDILQILDNKEILIGDFSPDNIILDDNNKIFMIDFEYYSFYNDIMKDILGTSGFWCKKYKEKQATIYAFFALWYYLYYPQEYNKILLESEMVDTCDLDKFKIICKDIFVIMKQYNYTRQLQILKAHI